MSAADERRAEALLLLIERRKARIAEDFYDLGEALREISRRRLYLALGHGSFAEMLRARRIMGLTQAKKLIEVVSALPRDKAMGLGPEKAYALARYAAATPEVDNVRDRSLAALGRAVDTAQSLLADEAQIAGKAIDEVSVREIAEATGKVRAKAKSRGSKPIPAEEREALQSARQLQSWLRKRGAKDAIAMARKGKGGWWLHLELRVDAAGSLMGE